MARDCVSAPTLVTLPLDKRFWPFCFDLEVSTVGFGCESIYSVNYLSLFKILQQALAIECRELFFYVKLFAGRMERGQR